MFRRCCAKPGFRVRKPVRAAPTENKKPNSLSLFSIKTAAQRWGGMEGTPSIPNQRIRLRILIDQPAYGTDFKKQRLQKSSITFCNRVQCVFSERVVTQKKSRKYQMTINNPVEHGFSHEVIKDNLAAFKSIEYWCLCDEIGEKGTPHTHVYLASPNAILFDSLHKRFFGAHIEVAHGSHKENRDYIRKEGKWTDSEKKETNLSETFEESGELPPEYSKQESVNARILGMIEEGQTSAAILRSEPAALSKIQNIEAARQAILSEEYRDKWRDLDVTYLWGPPGTGKTRSVMEKYGYSNVYRVTNYAHPFDGYQGQAVILFDEFRSSLPFSDMLNYLDGYPVQLPCRYADKTACYTKVYIISNISLEKQYPNIQQDEPLSYQAFLRRIHHVWELSDDLSDIPFGGDSDAE